jgi:nitrogen fixation-related uncharacterized protein
MALYLIVFGSLLLAVVSLMIWAARRGEFRDREAAKFRVLDLDRETGVKFDG